MILDPYSSDVAPFSAVASAFRSALVREMVEPVDFYEVHLDMARSAGSQEENPLVDYLDGRIKGRPVDLAVCGIGIPCEGNEVIERLHQVANAPVFGYFASEFGLGTIGGRLYQEPDLGQRGARTAARILRGERPQNIPPEIIQSTVGVYDWRELKRWGVSEARLPAGSSIEFRQPGAWERYRWPITGGGLFLLLQAVLIIGLLINRAQRRQGEAAAALIADLSSRFVNLPAHELDREIVDAQRRVCTLLGLDAAALWQWSAAAPDVLTLTHHYSAQEPPRPLERMTQDDLPWYREQMLAGRIVTFASPEDLPSAAAHDRQSCRRFGVKSHLGFPLSVGSERLIGALGFSTTRAERAWPDVLVKRLQLVAQVFANALARRRTDQALQESEERLRLVVEQAPDAIVVLDLEQNRLVQANAQAERLFGCSRGELLASSLQRFYAAEQPDGQSIAQSMEAHHERALRGETVVFELAICAANGQRLVCEVRLVRLPAEERMLLRGSLTDITEAKRSQAALHASEELNRTTFEQAAVGIAHVGIDGRWLKVNDRLCAILGYRRDELIRLTFRDITDPEDLPRELDLVRQILSGAISTFSMEKRYIRKGGSMVWVRLTVSLVRDGAGVPLHLISVAEDITAGKQAEAEISRQQAELAHLSRVTMLGELSGSMAHELNQPLTAILANAQAAQRFFNRDEPDLSQVREILGDIAAEGKRAGEVIRRLRLLLTKGEVKLQPLDVNSVILEVLTLLRSDMVRRGVSVRTQLARDLPSVRGDRVQLQQVLLNLVVNACDAMAGTAGHERQLTLATGLSADESVCISVADSGTGLSPHALERAFEPFYTTKAKGMGLGLAVCRTIVSSHGGKLWAANNPARGATFHCTLPVNGAGAESGARGL